MMKKHIVSLVQEESSCALTCKQRNKCKLKTGVITIAKFALDHKCAPKSHSKVATFPPELENELVCHLLTFQKRVLGLSKKQIRRIAFEFAEWLGISSSRFDRVRRVADKRWYHDLETRHPHVCVFKTRLQQENLDSTAQEEKVKKFLDYLENITYKY
uniref:Uncharacterized protein n=1 Tax=Timema poppense TaxID=170557 RepID=A0A7R9DPF5_TIMPO|nr:unnamed protein product [Timema poppensis]